MSHVTGSFILLCWSGFFLFIGASAFFVKRTAVVARGWKWSLLLFSAAIAAGLLLYWGRPLPASWAGMMLWRHTAISGGCADTVVVAGLTIALWGRGRLGRNWNFNPGLKENHELIETGPYAYVRHPMYSGLLMMLLGTVIWCGAATGLIFFAACFAGTWLKLRREEALLAKHFGESYSIYRARVKALIPFVL